MNNSIVMVIASALLILAFTECIADEEEKQKATKSCTASSNLTMLMEIRHSHHDFSGAAWSNNEICVPCHTPHNADMNVMSAPLWNHEVTTASYTVYASSSLNAAPGQPSGVSRLCLSCHDGTVAFDNHGGATNGSRFTNFGNLSTILSDDHPISFLYNSALAAVDGELRDPDTAPSGLGGTITDDLLENGSLECTSCHDVHISRNTQGCTGCHNTHGPVLTTKTLSLRVSNDNSALCFTCHIK
jgi:predicted CXXCH cytochrome family protein